MPGTITVACKLPHGLVLQLCRMEERQEPVMGGGTRVQSVAARVGKRVTIKGYAHEINETPNAPIIGGYALTHNVDADFFEEWLKQNAEHDAVKNKLVFAHAKPDVVQSEARNAAKVRNGLEPMAQESDPRSPKKVSKDDNKAA
jgi:hypothetical protein